MCASTTRSHSTLPLTMRVLVRVVLGCLAHGETTTRIIGEFPSLGGHPSPTVHDLQAEGLFTFPGDSPSTLPARAAVHPSRPRRRRGVHPSPLTISCGQGGPRPTRKLLQPVCILAAPRNAKTPEVTFEAPSVRFGCAGAILRLDNMPTVAIYALLAQERRRSVGGRDPALRSRCRATTPSCVFLGGRAYGACSCGKHAPPRGR